MLIDFFVARDLDTLDIVKDRLTALGITPQWNDQLAQFTDEQFVIFLCEWNTSQDQFRWKVKE